MTLGLGDYRIPNAALIDENGVKVEVDDLAPAGRGSLIFLETIL
jgi:hypothetical protein